MAPETRVTTARRDVAALAVLLVAWALVHAEVLTGHVYFMRDIYDQYVPHLHVARWARLQGAAPLWNPSVGCGQPLLANPSMALLDPLSDLYLLLPVPVAMTWFIALHRVILLAGSYGLARLLGLGAEGALLSALLFGLGGVAASAGNLYQMATTLSFAPAAIATLLLAVDGPGIRSPGGRWRVVLAAACWALLYLGGEPFTMLMALVVALGLAVGRRPPDRGWPAHATAIAARLGAAGIGAIALAAANMIPTAELVRHSARGEGFSFDSYAVMSLHPLAMGEAFVPGFTGETGRLTRGAFWGGGLFDFEFPYLLSIYMGCAAWLLAWHAVPSRPWTRAAGMLAGLGLVMALGRYFPLNRASYALLAPLWVLRYPVKWMVLTGLTLPLLAGAGWESVRRDRRTGRRIALVGAAGGVALLVASSLPLQSLWSVSFPPVPGGIAMEEVARAISAALHRTGWLWIALGLLALAATRLPFSLATLGLATAVAVDLYPTYVRVNPTVDVTFFDAPAEAAALMPKSTPGPRILVGLGLHPDPGRLRAPSDDRVWHFYWLASALRDYAGISEGLRYGVDADPDDLRPHWSRQLRAMAAAGGTPGTERLDILREAAIDYYVGFESGPMPGTEIVGLVPTIGERPVHVRRIVGAKPWAGVEGGEPARVRSFAPNAYGFDVTAHATGTFVLRETFFSGWRATVDGVPVPVTRTERGFMSIPLARGTHRVAFTYEPTSYSWGVRISCATIIVMAVALLGDAWRRRRRPLERAAP